ncbi:MAG: hypothetical protein Q7W54_15165, partial [Bacteroidota bacterium]|nr:hypothetical protein [Bacteroidota bacterium]
MKSTLFTAEALRNPNASLSRLAGGKAANVPFIVAETGEWIRVKPDNSTKATVHFSYAQKDTRSTKVDPMFAGMASVSTSETNAGLLWGLGNNRRKLCVMAGTASDNGFTESG